MNQYIKHKSQFNAQPTIKVHGENYNVVKGWSNICKQLNTAILELSPSRKVVVIETYQGIIYEELVEQLKTRRS